MSNFRGQESWEVALTQEEGEALRDFICGIRVIDVPPYVDIAALHSAYRAVVMVFGQPHPAARVGFE